MTRSPEEILDLASADPHSALRLGGSLLQDQPPAAYREQAILYRAMSVANRVLRRFPDSIDHAKRARELAEVGGDEEQQLLAVVTMVPAMVILGQPTEALELIDASERLATTPFLEARLSYQRAVVWQLTGEPVKAIEAFEAALPAFRESGDDEMIRGTLQGLGYQRLVTGDLARAEQDLEAALAIAVTRNEEPSISGIKHNLGRIAAYRGDIVGALSLLLDSDEIYMRLTGSSAPQHVARCEVLLSAGLFREAHRLAATIAASNRVAGDPEHLADALLVTARAALLADDAAAALETGEEAATLFADHGRRADELDARRLSIEALLELEGPTESLLRAASDVAAGLEAEKLMVAAARAHLLRSRIAVVLGHGDEAEKALERVWGTGSGPIELRIHSRLAQARLRLLRADPRGADAAARSGLRLIDDYQAVLGATDLRMGLDQHGAELGAIGLDIALQAGDPRRIFRWMERTRARALRHRPVTSEADEQIRGDLSRLRQVEAELREAANRGDADLQRERRRLQERVKTADRLKRAISESEADPGIDTLIGSLGDRALLEIAIHEGKVVGVLVRNGRARRLDLGQAERVLTELGHVRFEMRRAARRGRPVGPQSLAGLDRMLLSDTRLDSDELVLVPPPSLMAAPWAALPSLRDKVLTIAPSAEMWWRSSRRRAPDGGGAVVAGGPDLAVARSEVAAIGGLYSGASIFPPGATVDVVRAALENAAVAHIACHATFQVENPMFSSLRLGDGDLNVYDIERLGAPPSTVVLSACDSGYTEARSGDELAGLTSALLSMGARSVVASVGLVPDTPAILDLMVGLHQGLIAGLAPSKALSRAQNELFDDPDHFVAAASFICVGA